MVRWGPKQAIALAAVPFESVAGDEPSPRPEILDAYWLSRLDADGDGYYRTGSRLTWITYIEDSEEHQVMAYIYADAVGTVSNTPIATLSYNCDNTTETDNSVSVDLPELDHGRYDFRIKLVDSSDITVVVWYVSDSVPDLQSVPLEPASEDSPVYSLADVRWSNLVDEDGDGYWREGLHFVLDVDVSDTAVHSVKAVIFRRSGLTATWNEGVTTNCFEVSGSGTEDSMPVAIIGCPSGKYDFRVDIYACTGSTEILASRGPGEDADMKSVSIESTEEDEATQKFSIGSVRWTGGRDADQDGYSGGGGTISWIPEMDGKGTCSVFARVYYRKHGIQEWRLLNHTEDMIIVGGSPGNTMSVKVSNLIHGEYDFKIDIIDCESGVVITSCGPKKDRDLARVRLETSAEDQPRTQTKRKAGRMFAGISGGIHVVRIRQNSEDTWKGLVSFGGAIRQIGTVGFETVVFFSDSVKIFEGGIAGLDIAPSLLIFGDALSFSAKMGVIWMRPKRIGPDFFRGRIDYISGYVGGGMYLGMVGRTHRRDKWRIGLSAYALYSEEKKYYWTDDLGFPDYPGVGDILTLGGPSGGISLLLEF